MECGKRLQAISDHGAGVVRATLCWWLTGRGAELGARVDGMPVPSARGTHYEVERLVRIQWGVVSVGVGSLVPGGVLIGRLTFVMFPDSYKTSPEGTMAGASGVGDWSGS